MLIGPVEITITYIAKLDALVTTLQGQHELIYPMK